MKYISSTTLEKLLNDSNFKEKWSIYDAMKCLFAVAKGLSHLHGRLICHGNLCPSNIIIDEAKQSYLSDFGLYTIKKHYYDQEDIVNHDYKDPRMVNYSPMMVNDIYSFGVLMCQFCLIFFLPESKETLHEFITKTDQDKFHNFPHIFSELIPKCLFSTQISIDQIINHFNDSKFIIGQYPISNLFSSFINSNYILNLAKLGDSFALNKLGEMYEKGIIFEKDDSKALLYYEQAAMSNNSEAQANYGVLLQEGSVKSNENKIKGAKFLELSAKQGNIHGMANFGIALKEGDGVKKNIQLAEEYLKKSADLGYSYAQVNYGYTLLEVNPTVSRINEGLSYIRMAIDQCDKDAYYTLGILLRDGEVVAKDDALAMKYFKISADMGYEKAMVEFAKGNEKGIGIPVNKQTALHYYKLAFENGVDTVQKKIETLSKPKKNKKKKNQNQTKQTNQSTKETQDQKVNASSEIDFTPIIGPIKPIIKETTQNHEIIVVSSSSTSSSDDETIKNPIEFKTSSSSDNLPSIDSILSLSSSSSSSNLQSPNSKNQEEVIPILSQSISSKKANEKPHNQTDDDHQKLSHALSILRTLEKKSSKTKNEIQKTLSHTLSTQHSVSVHKSQLKTENEDKSSLSHSLSAKPLFKSQPTSNNMDSNHLSHTLSSIPPTSKTKSSSENSPVPHNSLSTAITTEKTNNDSQFSTPVKNVNSKSESNSNSNSPNIISVVSSSSTSPSNQPTANSQSPASITKVPKTSPEQPVMSQPLIISVNPLKNNIVQNVQQKNPVSILTTPKITRTINTDIYKVPKTVSVPPLVNVNIPFNENTPQDELISIFKKFKNEFRSNTSENVAKSKFSLFKYEDQFINTNNPIIIYKYGRLYDKDNKTKANKSKAMKYYKMSADLGNAKAQCLYGVALQNGKDVRKNMKEGFKYLEKSANQGYINGISNYGLALVNGDGTKKKKELGLKYLKSSADKGDPFAQLNFGLCTSDDTLGHLYVEKAVNANYKKAFFYYATDFMDGRGVKQDLQKAVDILLELYDMEKKNKVLINLIQCLKILDYKQFLKYTKILADLDDENISTHINNARFQYGLALFYGQDVEKNETEAIKYLANSNHMSKIRSKYPDIFVRMPHDFTSVRNNVNTFLKRNGQINPQEEQIIQSAYNGNADDTLEAAKLIEKAGDFKTSNFFYEIAADSNQREAAFILGKYYLEGKNGLQINQTKGNKYVNKSAELGYPEARFDIIKYRLKNIRKSSKDNNLMDDILNELNDLVSEKFVPAIIQRAKLNSSNGSIDEAKKDLQQALAIASDNPKVNYQAGKILLSISKDNQFGLNLIKNSSQSEPKASYLMAKYYLDNKDKSPENLELALNHLIKAAKYKIKDSQRLLISCKNEIEQKRRKQIPTPTENTPTSITNQTSPQASKPPKRKSKSKRKSKPQTNQTDPVNSTTPPIQTNPVNQPPQPNQNAQCDEAPTKPEDYIDLDLPNDELMRLGDTYREKNILADAFQCYEAVAKRGDPTAYFKCAEVCQKNDLKLQYYEYAIINKVPGALGAWRKCILGKLSHLSQEKDNDKFRSYAKRFEDYGDFSDAAITYKKAKDQLNSDLCYEKAKMNLQEIQDGQQQFDFAIFLEKQNETELAISMFKRALEGGVAQAEKKIRDLSKSKMNQLKKLNQVDSLLEQGICYMQGKNGTVVDSNKAFQCLMKASKIGCPKADFYIGVLYRKGFGDIQTNQVNCAMFFKKAADAGDSDGQNGYGECLRLGVGVEQNLDQAIRYFKLAADQDNKKGEFNYGKELYSKSSTEEEKNEATCYLKKSAEKLYPDGMYLYSKAIQYSNPDESKKIFELSIEKGSELAIKEYGKELKNDDRMIQAAELYKTAADKGYLIGYRKYAKCIINGTALRGDEDDEAARDYFKKAAELGEAKDQFAYAEFLFQCFNEDSTDERALYYKKAAEYGYVKAFFRYAECLSNGNGVPKDLDLAKKFYTLSYRKDPDSQVRFILPKLKEQNLIYPPDVAIPPT